MPLSGKFNMFDTIRQDRAIPAQFRHLGYPKWWGLVQAYFLRLQPKVEAHILQKAQLMGNCTGFPFGTSVAGLHVRHGDKHVDGFKEHSYFEEVSSLVKSPDCASYRENRCYTADGKELPVFVASDDSRVIQDASINGHFTTPTERGVSQITGSAGMVMALKRNPSWGYNASLEVLSDIYFLSHCSSLIGVAASQIFRASVGLSNATGLLKFAAAVDLDQVARTIEMSKNADVIFAEEFKNAKSNRF